MKIIFVLFWFFSQLGIIFNSSHSFCGQTIIMRRSPQSFSPLQNWFAKYVLQDWPLTFFLSKLLLKWQCLSILEGTIKFNFGFFLFSTDINSSLPNSRKAYPSFPNDHQVSRYAYPVSRQASEGISGFPNSTFIFAC